MKKTLLIAGLLAVTLYSCKRDDDNVESFDTTKQSALNDFVDVVAIRQYSDLATKASVLNDKVVLLNTTTNQANLEAARTAWTDLRAVWEQCEGFLFGPVDEEGYDPKMDTWPTDFAQMDSLMNTSIVLNQNSLDNITLSLRGFHPLEYILFGDHGNRTPASITARQKEYMLSLAADVMSNCSALSTSWATAGGNYGNLVKTAGQSGNTLYTKRSEIFLAIADGLITICEEVGEGKMEDPLGPTAALAAPELVESPYSGNSVIDFKNNIIGVENVYTSRYSNKTGKSLSNLVAANNQALDNKIKSQIAAAISSFSNITMKYEEAIINQRPQILQTQAALATLKTTLEDELRPYIIQYIKD